MKHSKFIAVAFRDSRCLLPNVIMSTDSEEGARDLSPYDHHRNAVVYVRYDLPLHDVVKSCRNCFHRMSDGRQEICGSLGFPCAVSRSQGARCGPEAASWAPMPGAIERFLTWWFGIEHQ